MIEWARPFVLLLLPLPLLAYAFQTVRLNRAVATLSVPERVATLFATASGEAIRQRRRRILRAVFAWGGWLAIVCALAAPITRGAPLQQASGRDLLLAIDLSSSMKLRDVSLNGQPTDRYSAVKTIASEFIRGRAGDRIGLIVFANDAYLLAPLSFDTEAVAGYLHEVVVGLPGQKTAVGDAIGLAINTLREQPEAARVLILLSDGESNAGSLVPTRAAELARKHNVRVHTIGFSGSQQIDAKDEVSGLTQIAEQSGGRHYRADSTAALRRVYVELDLLEPTELDSDSAHEERDWESELLWLALACLCVLSFFDWREQRI